MTLFWIGLVVGCVAFYVFERTVMRFVRRQLDPTRTKTIRRQLLDGMGYDTLIAFQAAVEAELRKRRGADETAPGPQ